jgi:ABC-type amino acid transport substrate-binding protein
MKYGRWLLGALASAAMLVAACGAEAAATSGGTSGGTLARIRQDDTIRIAYREDAPPFSYLDKAKLPAGFMIDLCHAVVDNIAKQLGLPSLKIAYVQVTATDRFTAIEQHKADLLCEATSATLSRREVVDFSLSTFVDGAGILARSDAPNNLKALAGHKVGVLAGTTTEHELNRSLKSSGIAAEVVPVRTHTEGLAMLEDGKISAYFADRAILAYLMTTSKAPDKLMLADNYLTIEPYALALPHGDEDFRLAVDRALSQIYRSGAIRQIFQKTFGAQAQPGAALQALYLITGLPE